MADAQFRNRGGSFPDNRPYLAPPLASSQSAAPPAVVVPIVRRMLGQMLPKEPLRMLELPAPSMASLGTQTADDQRGALFDKRHDLLGHRPGREWRGRLQRMGRGRAGACAREDALARLRARQPGAFGKLLPVAALPLT